MSNRVTDIPNLVHCWKFNNLYLAGQPGEGAFKELSERGVKKIINIRSNGEADFSKDKEKVEALGMEYHHIPVLEDGKLQEKAIADISSKIDESDIVVHCGSANRVAGWLIVHLARNGYSFDQAVKIAQDNGLSSPGFIEQAEDILNS